MVENSSENTHNSPTAVAQSPGAPAEGGFWTRFFTAIPLILGAGVAVWQGSYLFSLLVLLAVSFGVREFCLFVEKKGFRADYGLALVSSMGLVIAASFADYLHLSQLLLLCLLAVLLAFVANSRRRISAILDSSSTVLLIIYCGWLPAHFIVLRNLSAPGAPAGELGLCLVSLLIAVCIASDVGAYAFGKLFGCHKLCPTISPGKTKEGAAGGLFLAVLVGAYVGHLGGLPLEHVLALSLLGSIVSQCGDLFESSLKRDAGVKDSGNLIKGHGGALDRCDSYLLTVPFFYLYVSWFML